MTKFTNKQLTDQAREEVAFWRERDELIPSQQTAIRLRLAEIAMVVLMTPEPEPVADVVAWSSPSEERTCDIRWRRHDVKPGPLYTAPPTPVVPENPPEHLLPQGNSRDATYRRGATINGWMLCRAAMLQGAEPVSQRDEFPDDTRRLDWLDAQNKRLNQYYGTSYGWKFDANFQRNAMMLNDSNYPVMTVRQAIDEAIAAAPQQEDPQIKK